MRSSTISNKGDSNTSKITEKKRQHKQQGSIINDGTATERGSLGIVSAKKPRRRRYDNNFKAEVLDHLKGPHTKLSDVARRYGIPENTLREWTKLDVVHAIETARSKNSGQLKANMYDPMRRLTETLMVFFEHNSRQPEHLRQPITTKLIVAKVRRNIVFQGSFCAYWLRLSWSNKSFEP
jgi:transposase-like protein